MSEQFTEYRVQSLSNPNNGVGLITGFACMSNKKYFTRQELEMHEVSIYEDDFPEDRRQEELVLQAKSDGEWLTIKEVSLLPGERPEPDYGNCRDCDIKLEESEFAAGVICSSCLKKVHEEREASTW
jgi:hypothetical protein